MRGLIESYEASSRASAAPTTAPALKGRPAETTAQTEFFTTSAHFGSQNELQAGLAHVRLATGDDRAHFALNLEALTARANLGTHNDDGSTGANAGALATAVGAEVTLESSGWSLTAGLSASHGAAVSSGEADRDGDGIPEKCFKVSVEAATIGFCTEFE